jgi:hypothetical protein
MEFQVRQSPILTDYDAFVKTLRYLHIEYIGYSLSKKKETFGGNLVTAIKLLFILNPAVSRTFFFFFCFSFSSSFLISLPLSLFP